VSGAAVANGHLVTVASLAEAKRLPVEFLAGLGVHDLPGGGVGITYYDHPNSEQLFVRERDSPRRKGKRFWQPPGVKLAAYGQWRIEEARKVGFLVVVEGESDCWALWHGGLPALGVPGCSSWNVLVPEWLEQIDRVYIVREPGQSGDTFVPGVVKRLKAIGYTGEVHELRMPGGLKDPADLHCADPAGFFRAFGLVMGDAARLDAPVTQEAPDRGDAWEGDREASALPVGAEPNLLEPISLGELIDRHPTLRPSVIHGLLRRGETMNVISTSKVGKSWFVTDLALTAAAGGDWLGTFQVERGKVLIIDNELHPETLADRLRKVAEARGIPLQAVRDSVFVRTLRGRLRDILSLGPYFRGLQPGRFDLVVLDAYYRMLPEGVSENDNAAMAGVYNAIDSYADHLGCSFVCIHHSSKGSQADKAVTDVGAGAGSQSRAADTHLVLRPHEEDGVFVLEAALRSWAPVEPRCLRWEFPVWHPAEDLSPELLRRPEDRRKQAAKSVKEKQDDGALLAELDRLDEQGASCGVRQLRAALGWGHDRTDGAIDRLVGAGILEMAEATYQTGKGKVSERTCRGVRRRRPG
jgi:hypothetical protein